MSLYHKYRPNTLDEMVGNEETIDSLKTILTRKRVDIPHVFLFFGPSGCGKTTVARILAKELGANDMDITEINFADQNGVDTARDIRAKMFYRPSCGEARVWILDEFHMATAQAINCLLKPMEDTPPFTYFMICTTNPAKVIGTTKTRSVQYVLNSYTEDQIKYIVKRVARGEKKPLSQEVYDTIAASSFGSGRLALNILEKVIDLPEEKQVATAKIVADMEMEGQFIGKLLLNKKTDWKDIAQAITNAKSEPESIRQQILGYATAIILKSANPRAYLILECFHEDFYTTGKSGLARACWMTMNV